MSFPRFAPTTGGVVADHSRWSRSAPEKVESHAITLCRIESAVKCSPAGCEKTVRVDHSKVGTLLNVQVVFGSEPISPGSSIGCGAALGQDLLVYFQPTPARPPNLSAAFPLSHGSAGTAFTVSEDRLPPRRWSSIAPG